MKLTTTSVFGLLASVACGLYVPALARSELSPPLHQPPSLARRANEPASDDIWDRAKCLGAHFVKVFPMSDKDAGQEYSPKRDSVQSQWKGDLKDDLKKWGWTEANLQKSVCEFDEFALGKGWVDAAKELGIGTEGWKDIWCHRFTHGSVWDVAGDKKYTADNKDYPYTGAYGQFGINSAGGAILAMDNLMPSSAIRRNKQRDPLPGELPALQSLSDLLFGGWYRGSQPETSMNADVRNLKYLISVSVTNPESLSIIQRALKAKEKTTVSYWPGDTFDMSTDEGQALLGSANGRRWGYLLTQRKNDIGIK
ncbi:hypothetical protein SLS60_002636 [Paraconiothyrium brasiliense]|uniref:Uncharacterized protein n=1 Tax=Paraconiothyrium brasiliense TaxID=300254 RepID=A0ABR3RTE0_9PLEO